MSVGKRLKEERERLRLTQDVMAKAGGVGKGTQINYEQDYRSPDTNYLVGVDGIGVDVLYVITGHRRIDRATTQSERALLEQAIAFVIERSKSQDVGELAPLVQERYDDLYAAAARQSPLHPGAQLGDREQDLLTNFAKASAEGKKFVERLAAFEAGAGPAASETSAVSVKGHGNVVGSHVTVGEMGQIRVSKRR